MDQMLCVFLWARATVDMSRFQDLSIDILLWTIMLERLRETHRSEH
jgi:hypothetical protein